LIEPDVFKRGMRRLAAGVSLVTTVHDSVFHGLLATAVNSVSADPPTVLVCVNRASSAHAPIAGSGIFCVNFLGLDNDEVAQRFSSPIEREKRFQAGDWRDLGTGSPALFGALASLDCRVTQMVEVSSHTVFFGEVLSLELWTERSSPLVYVDGSYLPKSTFAASGNVV